MVEKLIQQYFQLKAANLHLPELLCLVEVNIVALQPMDASEKLDSLNGAKNNCVRLTLQSSYWFQRPCRYKQ